MRESGREWGGEGEGGEVKRREEEKREERGKEEGGMPRIYTEVLLRNAHLHSKPRRVPLPCAGVF